MVVKMVKHHNRNHRETATAAAVAQRHKTAFKNKQKKNTTKAKEKLNLTYKVHKPPPHSPLYHLPHHHLNYTLKPSINIHSVYIWCVEVIRITFSNFDCFFYFFATTMRHCLYIYVMLCLSLSARFRLFYFLTE